MTAKLFDPEILLTLFTLFTPAAARVKMLSLQRQKTDSDMLDLQIISHQNPGNISEIHKQRI